MNVSACITFAQIENFRNNNVTDVGVTEVGITDVSAFPLDVTER